MTLMAVAVGGGAVLGFLGSQDQASAAQSAASDQAQASVQAAQIQSNAALQASQMQITAAQQAQQQSIAVEQPWLNAGAGALQNLQAGTAAGGAYNTPFTMADAQNTPAMQFALAQGEQQIQAQGARAGLGNSTNTTQGAISFAEGNAAQYENQAFNQHQAQTQMALNAQQSLAGQGQTTAAQVAGLTTQGITGAANAGAAGIVGAANATGQGVMGSANALAAGTVGAANAYSGALSNIGNSAMQGLGMYQMSNILGLNNTQVPLGASAGNVTDMSGFSGNNPAYVAPTYTDPLALSNSIATGAGY